jgi:hypothetical protein
MQLLYGLLIALGALLLIACIMFSALGIIVGILHIRKYIHDTFDGCWYLHIRKRK